MKQVSIRFDTEDHEFLRLLSFHIRKSMNQIIVEQVQKLKKESDGFYSELSDIPVNSTK